MNHIVIKQDTTGTEEVSSAVITALYNAVNDEYLDNNSELQGRLHSSYGGRKKIDYLTTTFLNLFITVDNYTIDFEDPEVEQICATNWGDGYIVTDTLLALVLSIGNLFKNNTNIVKFNEFKYFTSLGNSWSFEGCSNLEEITLPANKNSLPEAAFKNCSSLQSWDLSKTPGVSKNSFADCSSCLFTNFSSMNSCGEWAFKGCTLLTDIIIKDGANLGGACFESSGVQNVTFSGDFSSAVTGSTFNECKNLQSVTFEAPFSYVPFRMFRKSSISTVDFSNALSYLPSTGYLGSIFAECSNLITVTLSNNVNILPEGMFIYSNLLYLTIPANVTLIGSGCFYACRQATITCLATTPPTLLPENNSENYTNFGMVPSIKVPAASLEAYKTATGWSKWADIISAIAS